MNLSNYSLQLFSSRISPII